MLTAYRLQLGTVIRLSPLLELNVSDAQSASRSRGGGDYGIGLLHCNNINSSTIFDTLAGGLEATERAHLMGADRQGLLSSLHHFTDGFVADALEILETVPEVVNNRTSRGGVNELGDVYFALMSAAVGNQET